MTDLHPESASVDSPWSALGLWRSAPRRTEADGTMASPSWWGADSTRCILTGGDGEQTAFVKIYEGHTSHYVDWALAATLARLAGETGLGPRVLASARDGQLIAFEHLASPWRTATVDDFDDNDRAAALLTVRAKVGALGAEHTALPRRWVFDEISDLHGLALRSAAALPSDIDWMLRQLKPAATAISARGWTDIACHGDGNTSNVMVDDAGGIRLLDWDSAALMDPLQDLGPVLFELRPLDNGSAHELFEAAFGSFDQDAFDRCRIYGVADAIRWGLIATFADSARPGTHEYSKFADWQFLRARFQLSQPQFTARIRRQTLEQR